MWALVGRFSTIGEAESARSALEAAGIPCDIADENIIAIDWLYANAVGSVKLLVPAVDRDDAAELLRSTAAAPSPDLLEPAGDGDEEDSVPAPDAPSSDPDPGSDAAVCPVCQSVDAPRIPRRQLFLALAVVACGVGMAVEESMVALTLIAAVGLLTASMPSHRCPRCSARFDAAESERSSHAPRPEQVEARCPRCDSPEFYHVEHRRLRALPLLAGPLIFAVVPIWLFLPKWRCDSCGYWTRLACGRPRLEPNRSAT